MSETTAIETEPQRTLEAGLEAAPHALTARRQPLHALTGIRLFAAFFVVAFHSRLTQLCQQHHLAPLANFFANGFLAVPLFFVLSGFILSYTYEGQIEKPGDHRRFWEARMARIWPVYAVSLLLSSVPSLRFPPLPDALATLAMVQAWNPLLPNLAGTWNFVCWTLSCEAFFYLVFPWVQVWLEARRPRAQLGWIVAMLLVCLLTNSASRTLGYSAHGIYRFIPLPLAHVPEFFVGVGLGNHFLHQLAERRAGLKGPLLPGRGLWTYLSAAATLAWLCVGPGPLTALIVVCFALLVYGLAAEDTLLARLLSTRLMLLGGGISYSIYLMQLPVKNWIGSIAHWLHSDSPLLHLVLDVTLLTLISLILFKAVEDPARKLLRGLFARLEERRQSPASR